MTATKKNHCSSGKDREMSRSRVWAKVANKASNTVTVTASWRRISSASDVYRHRAAIETCNRKDNDGYNHAQERIKNGRRQAPPRAARNCLG